jgi:GxxExxY protein
MTCCRMEDLELKAVELLPVYKAQVLTCLKLSGYRLGLLINFNSVLIMNGIQRIAPSPLVAMVSWW